ncbi:hypothetical protein [Streptomyces sp. NPDC090057]|uniref:hypothetical protein n=1 Tax=Streptomyces sp. NPDC090057 TaxID=3365935 RepID=UPI00380B2734
MRQRVRGTADRHLGLVVAAVDIRVTDLVDAPGRRRSGRVNRMTAHIAHDTLVEDVARVVAGVPGVAFLKPVPAARLRSAWSGPGAGRPPVSGVRLTPGPGGRQVDVQVVAARRERAVDVAAPSAPPSRHIWPSRPRTARRHG